VGGGSGGVRLGWWEFCWCGVGVVLEWCWSGVGVGVEWGFNGVGLVKGTNCGFVGKYSCRAKSNKCLLKQFLP
jgi:hypothetical protein